MQPPLTYSWIALTASAPVILLLTCWNLAMFYRHRNQWTTVEVFLTAILSQSIIQQFLGFAYSILVLLKFSSPLTGEAVCTAMMWFFIFIPIFKGTTIASLALDRWLYYTRFSYRLSIRKNHIRYHIAVLAIFSCTVGFTALITFNNPELLTSTASSSQYSFDQCTFLPFKFDLKFVIFYLSVHLIVILLGTTVLCKSLCHKKSNANNSQMLPQVKKLHYKRRRSSPPLDITPTLSNTSTASSSISNSSPTNFFSTPGLSAKAVLSNSPNNAFHEQLKNQSRMDFSERNKNDDEGSVRLTTALGILILTILCTHFPFTIGTILSRLEIFVPIASIGYGSGDQLTIFNWPVVNLLLWLQVIEGLLVLLVLLIVDSIVPGWLFNRSNKKMLEETPKPHHGYSVAVNPPRRETNFHLPNLNNRSNENGHPHYTNPAFSPDFKSSNKFPITNGSLFMGVPTPSSSNIRPGIASGRNPATNDEARFQSVFQGRTAASRQSRNDFDSIGGGFQEDESEYDRKSYHHRYASVASVTTVANDDFEFHQSRPEIFQRQQQLPINKDYNPSTYVVPKLQQSQPSQNIFNAKTRKSLESEKRLKLKQQPHIYEEFEFRKQPNPPKSPIGTVGISQQPTSLSMNDLDLIDDTQAPPIALSSSRTTEPFEHKQRMYRKRTRMQPSVGRPSDRRGCQKSSDQLSDRRVLSMECLSPKQTDNRNFLDISYMDTGEMLVRKADSSKCIFVTDFI